MFNFALVRVLVFLAIVETADAAEEKKVVALERADRLRIKICFHKIGNSRVLDHLYLEECYQVLAVYLTKHIAFGESL